MILRVQEDVRGRYVTMKDVAPMAQAQSDESLAHPSDGQVRRDPNTVCNLGFGRAHGCDVGGNERHIVVNPGVEHPQDVGTLQVRQHSSLAHS